MGQLRQNTCRKNCHRDHREPILRPVTVVATILMTTTPTRPRVRRSPLLLPLCLHSAAQAPPAHTAATAPRPCRTSSWVAAVHQLAAPLRNRLHSQTDNQTDMASISKCLLHALWRVAREHSRLATAAVG